MQKMRASSDCCVTLLVSGEYVFAVHISRFYFIFKAGFEGFESC